MKMVYVLFAAVAAGAAIGAARSFSGSPTPAAEPAPAAIAAEPGAPPDEAPPGVEAPAAIEGQVLEIIQVPNYSYLRIGAPGSEGTWAAVPTTSLAVGDQARIHDAMRIEKFASTALKRTFPVIYFGTLEGGGATHAMAPADAVHDPHAKGALPAASGDDADEMKAAHPPLGAVDVRPVERAKGPDARTVAELIAERTKLVGKKVRIHATVVKATPGVLGRTFLHLRDGSGDPAKGTHDIVVTTTSTPQVGETIVVEGTVAIDRDIGAGYKFPTIVEDANVLAQP